LWAGTSPQEGGIQVESTDMKQKLLSRSSVLYVLDMDPEVFDQHISPYLAALEMDGGEWYDPEELQELLDGMWGRKDAVILEFIPKDRGGDSESTE